MADEQIVIEVVYDVDESEKKIDGLTESVIDLENANKSLRQDLKKSDKQLSEENKSRKELSTQLAKNSESLKDTKKGRKELIKIQKLQANSLDALKAKNKELIESRNQIDLSTKKGQKSMAKLNQQIKKNNETLGNAEKQGGNFGRSVGNYTQGIKDAIPSVGGMDKQLWTLAANPIGAVIAAIALAVMALFKAFSKTQGGADMLGKAFAGISSIVDVIIGRISKLANIVGKLIKGDISFSEAKEESKAAFEGIREEIEKTVKESSRIFDLTVALRKFNIEATKTLATLSAEAEKQAAIADDATRSFQEREAAAKKSEAAVIAQRQTELKLTQKALEIVQAENKLKEEQGVLTDELKQKEADLIAANIEAQSNLTLSRIDASKRRAELAQDNFEQELDFLLDVSDAQKTVNEKRIQDERILFDERKGILDDTRTLLNDSFEQQLSLFERELQVNLERDKLLKLNNQEIFEYARGLGLSEIATNRLLEVIKERRFAVQDIADLEKDIADEQKEREQARREEEIAEIEAKQELEDQLLQQTIDSSNAKADAEIERFDKVRDAEQKRYEEEQRVLEARGQAFANTFGAISNATAAFIDGEDDAFKNLGKLIVGSLIDTLQKTIIAKNAEILIQSLATPDSVLSFGASGALRAAGIIALTTAAGVAAKVALNSFGDGGQVPLMAHGGSIKSGTFSGASHSGGGIDLFTGSGQPVANVEGNENFYVLNKNASDMLNALSTINQGTGGVPLSKSSNFMQDGGKADMSQPQNNQESIANIVAEVVKQLPTPVVQVVDISTGITDRQNVKNVAVVA